MRHQLHNKNYVQYCGVDDDNDNDDDDDSDSDDEGFGFARRRTKLLVLMLIRRLRPVMVCRTSTATRRSFLSWSSFCAPSFPLS